MSVDLPGRPRLAVLIDAENIAAARAKALFDEVAKLGRATAKRIYGDWTRPDMAQWRAALGKHAIVPIQQFRMVKGKSCADCALIVDAMDLLYTGRFDGFCIVSSDSDFARLAHRLRESGLFVYGFGAGTTPEGFVNACDRFIVLDPPQPAPKPAPAPEPAPAPAPRPELNEARLQLVRAAFEAAAGEDGWAEMTTFGNSLRKLSPSFKPIDLGCAKLGRFVELSGLFEIKKLTNGKDAALTIWRIKWRTRADQPQD